MTWSASSAGACRPVPCRGMVASAISAPASSTAIQGEGYKSLAEGAQVDYEPQQGEKGPQAANVTLVA